MKLPNAYQIKELDAYTIQQRDIKSVDLMEEAASKTADYIGCHITNKNRPIVVFAGPGNNGGDGLVIARLLNKDCFQHIQVFLFNTNNSLSEDCKANAERLKEECPEVSLTEIQQQFEAPEISEGTIIIDALFGTGLNKPLGGGYAALIKFINASQAYVISVDMPSGLMCEDNTYNSPSAIVRADLTLTLGLPKLALILPDNQVYTGKVVVINFDLCYDKLADMSIPYQITTSCDIARLLKKRPAFGHKGTFGNALLIAGKYGMAGAAMLAAKACLRSGVGKVVAHVPTLNNNIMQTALPEVVLQHDESEHQFTTPVKTDDFDALAIGPGLGTDKRTALAFIEQTSHADIPMVIDADGINILGSHKGWISQIPTNTIFTPHAKEMQRFGICNADSYSILLEAINMAKQHHFYICLKGHFTAICTPNGEVFFNHSGNSGMATAGSGDVLTGIILALLAQKYSEKDACLLGVYLHGLAGDLAANELGEHAVMASDIIQFLPQAFKRVNELKNTPCESNAQSTSGFYDL